MKDYELRKGNFVTLPFEKDKLHKVRAYDIYCLEKGMDSEAMQPIPLTEEWLERFGFYETSRYGKYLEFNINQDQVLRFPICKHSEKDFWYVLRGSVKIQYVHELQNLYFALTGQELEIK